MARKLLIAAVLFACAGRAVADEKDEKGKQPGATAGPPPGKGWRKNEPPAPTPAPTPAPKGKTPAPPAKEPAKPPVAKTPEKKPDDGIGPTVSKWAKSGIHGRELAAKIHQLQAARAKTTPTPPATKPGKKQPEPTPPPTTPKKKKKDGKNEDD